jgi:hypothetical protein
MLGGGTFITQNKVLPGAYINFISMAKASATLSDRGVVAVPIELDWGIDAEVFEVSAGDVISDSLKLLGYSYTDDKMINIRELFRNARSVLFYRLNTGNKATATIGVLTATAKWSGQRGNDLRVVIETNVDDPAKKDVKTLLGTTLVDTQIVADASGLVANDFIDFSGTGALTNTAGTDLTSGTNGTVTGTNYQNALDKFEAYAFNTLVCPTSDGTTIALFDAYTKRMRDEIGAKFQTIVYRTASDYEGIISVENMVTDAGVDPESLVYWVGGLQAAAQINRSTTNAIYDGEYTVNVDYKQSELSDAILAGKYMFHRVGDQVRVLSDINTFVTITQDKGADFSLNQVIRVLDQIANDVAVLFNTKYLGKIQNNAAGRVSFWGDIVSYNRQLETLQAIENFDPDEVVVEAGADKQSVAVTNPITPVAAMTKLYMTVMVR